MAPMRNVAVGLCGLSLLVITAACGPRSSEPPVAPVEGKVTQKGKALGGGTILFVHKLGRPYSADINSDGTYKLNVAIGECKVAVDWREAGKEEKGGKPGMIVPGKRLVAEKYTEATTSGLSYEVKAGTNTGVDFDLGS
jgi:hypothetical protein